MTIGGIAASLDPGAVIEVRLTKAGEAPGAWSSFYLGPTVDGTYTVEKVPVRPRGTTVAGFDCSGFTQYVFRQHGVMLPRDSQDQFTAGHAVPQDETRPGDLVFFRTGGRRISHVGIALGDGTFVHAPNARGVVRVERMTSSYWARRLVGIRRMTP